ncbi:hypothetical protein P154DRAFT_560752 [Amniculicola lignicola CBS 123094]|uniref:SRP9 domain-containing protein n=1 Tax=Amniculicola lignicola CBS 123094 TaxID=1392246 RepID=A0A6A5WYY4_9PLEO|nr:hypothetical protein P154DRAFT_560752 [Amniculicola lignicola CBS 123094]
MPYLKTSTEWYEQSSLLLKARPTTTRITSKYSVLKPSSSKIAKREAYAAKRAARASTTSPPPQSQAPPQANPEEPTATFRLKTYDPVSGTCLQYETNKAAEVGRLIGRLGMLGRGMAGLEEGEELSGAAENSHTVEQDVVMGGTSTPIEQKPAAGGGGGKKKKKGKK